MVSFEIKVEVVFALPEKQYCLCLMLEEGATVEKALQVSRLLEMCRDIDLKRNKVGIYSRPVKLTDRLQNGDRIEIYRPITADPKELYRQRTESAYI